MSLPIPFVVWGTIYKERVKLAGVTVVVEDISTPQGSVSDTTDSEGRYAVNIRNIATVGDSMLVSANYSSKSRSKSFTLTLVPPSQNVDLIFDYLPFNLKLVKEEVHKLSSKPEQVYKMDVN